MNWKNTWRDFRKHPLALPLYLPTILIALSWGIREPVLPLYAREFGASYAIVGLILSAQHLGMLITDVPSGLILARLGTRRAMLLGMVCSTAGATALWWAQSETELFAYRLLSGFGYAVYSIARHAYLAESIPLASRGRAVALFGGLFRIGRFAGPALGGLIAAEMGLRFPFLLIALCNGMALAAVALFMPKGCESRAQRQVSLANYLAQLRTTLVAQRRLILPIGAGQLLAQMVRTAPATLIPLLGSDVLGLDVRQIGLVVSIGAAIDMSLFYPAGLIMDQFGRKFAIVPSFLLQGAGLLLVPLATGFGGLALATIVIGFGNGLSSGAMMTIGADLAPPQSRAPFLGIWRLIGDTGFMVGPVAVGNIANLASLAATAGVMGGAGIAAALIFLVLVPETLRLSRDR
jgi:MFS family permease